MKRRDFLKLTMSGIGAAIGAALGIGRGDVGEAETIEAGFTAAEIKAALSAAFEKAIAEAHQEEEREWRVLSARVDGDGYAGLMSREDIARLRTAWEENGRCT